MYPASEYLLIFAGEARGQELKLGVCALNFLVLFAGLKYNVLRADHHVHVGRSEDRSPKTVRICALL
jgi:hypothetical protein